MPTIIGFLIVAAVAVFVALPLVRPRAAARHDEADRYDELLSRRNTLYRQIADLDSEFQSGKVGDDEYTRERERYLDEAALVIDELERNPIAQQ
jgi:hypothetical protein